jgi:hypothetical protein
MSSAEALRQTEPALSDRMGLGRAKNNGAQPALSEFAQAGESNGSSAGVWLARALREHGTRKDPAHRKVL